MGRGNMEGYDSVINDALSMASLTKSIVGRDNTVQQTIMANWGGMEHFPETIAQLLEIDFSKVQVLLIGHTLNDYHAGEPIEDDGQWDNEHTFVGALRSTIRTLQKAYPDLRIILVSAPYTWYREHNLTCEEYVLGGNILEDYVNAQSAVAKETGVELIDLYHESYPHESWEDCATYTKDGLHPNEQGRAVLAQAIAEYLLAHPDGKAVSGN